jgi:outer membrane lipoprotein carrier protein
MDDTFRWRGIVGRWEQGSRAQCPLAVCLCIVASLGSVAAAPTGATTDADAVVRQVQARYDATLDFTADVTQEMTVASLGKTTRAHGTVAYKKPGKMRWELTDGEPQVIVADGTTLWLYQPNERQVLKAPFDAAFRSTAPVSFLTGVGRITQDFDVSLDTASEEGTSGSVRLVLVPRGDSTGVGQLRLTVARDTGEIQGAEIQDPLGNVSRLRFEHMRRNVGLGDERFVFDVPKGVDVITAPLGQ